MLDAMELVGFFQKRFHKDAKGFVGWLHACVTLIIDLLAGGCSIRVRPRHSRNINEADIFQLCRSFVELPMVAKDHNISTGLYYLKALPPYSFKGLGGIPLVPPYFDSVRWIADDNAHRAREDALESRGRIPTFQYCLCHFTSCNRFGDKEMSHSLGVGNEIRKKSKRSAIFFVCWLFLNGKNPRPNRGLLMVAFGLCQSTKA
jgi:hypothetical protein